MPAYHYDVVNADGKIVASVAAVLPVDERDQVVLVRRTVPDSINIGAAPSPMNQAAEVMRGYHRLEEKHGSRVDGLLGEFTPKQIKEAWSTPD